MEIPLGKMRVTTNSDGGVNFFPKWGVQTYFPMLSIEVIGSLSSDADLSVNERNTVIARWKHLIRDMRRRCTQKCWVKSTRAGSIKTAETWMDFKRLTPAVIFTYHSHSYSMQDIPRSTFSTPSFLTSTLKISLNTARNTKKRYPFRTRLSFNNRDLFVCGYLNIRRTSSDCFQKCFTISSAAIAESECLRRNRGINIFFSKRVGKCLRILELTLTMLMREDDDLRHVNLSSQLTLDSTNVRLH